MRGVKFIPRIFFHSLIDMEIRGFADWKRSTHSSFLLANWDGITALSISMYPLKIPRDASITCSLNSYQPKTNIDPTRGLEDCFLKIAASVLRVWSFLLGIIILLGPLVDTW